MAVKYSEQYIKGTGTSEVIGRMHEPVARQINALLAKRKNIANDRTRTDEEKASLYKRLKDEYAKAMEKSVNGLAHELLVIMDNNMRAKESARGNMSMLESVQLIAALRQAGVQGEDLRSAAISDVRIAQAMVNVPEAVVRAAKWTPEVAEEMLMRHFPDIQAAEAQYKADMAAYDRLVEARDEVLNETEKRAPKAVLETRVDENEILKTGV